MPKLAGEADECRPVCHDHVDLLKPHKVRRVASGFQRSLNADNLAWIWCEASGIDELFKHDNLSNPSRTMTIFVSSNQQLSKLSCKRNDSRSDLVDHSVKSGQLLETFFSTGYVQSVKITMVVGRVILHILWVQFCQLIHQHFSRFLDSNVLWSS